MVLAVPLVCLALFQQGPTVPLSGVVVGPKGEPVPGAEVLLGGLPVRAQKVVARGKTDAQGRFTIDRPAGLVGENRFNTPILWVVKPGFRLGCHRLIGPMPKAGEDVRIALGPPGKGEVHVEDPDGRPLPGARVRLEWFGRGQTNVPSDVEDLIEETTGRDGRAVIEAAANDEITYVDVHAKGFGIQGRPFRQATSQPKRVRLRQAASLEGRLQAGDPSLVKGWQVRAFTYAGDRWAPDPQTTGFAEGTTDAEGRFAFPAIAPGSLDLVFDPPRELPVLPEVPDSLAVTAGRPNSVVIPLRRTITITGLLREHRSGKPVPGVQIELSPLRGGKGRSTRTDAQGRYTLTSLPGQWRVSPLWLPMTLVQGPGQWWKDLTLTEGQGPVELEPWEAMPAAPPLRFIVRDENGRPAAHARIIHNVGTAHIPEEADDRGEFAAIGFEPGREVSVEVRLGDRMTDGPDRAIAGLTRPVEVTIRPGLAIVVAGRVLGPDGKPVADAAVRVHYRDRAPRGRASGLVPILNPDSRTGPDGRFRSPEDAYQQDREYRAEVIAVGYFNGKSDWIGVRKRGPITLPDLVLRPRPTPHRLAGRVVDREGKGIAGVTVFQPSDSPARTVATTDDTGRFRLDGVLGSPALVFAEKAGYRFGGAVARDGATEVEVRLARNEEPPVSVPKSLPPPLSRAEERAIARELLAPLLDPEGAGSLGDLRQFVVPALARVDPGRVLEMLENRVLTQPESVLTEVELGQFEEDPRAAIETLEANRNPGARAWGFLALADATTDAQEKLRRDLIERAEAEARHVQVAEMRLMLLRQVADHWLELGDVDRARPVLRLGRATIASMPRDQFSFAAEEFAEVLAVIDLRTATTILARKDPKQSSPIDPDTLQSHRGEAAVRLAAIDPAEAERFVPRVAPKRWDFTHDELILRICQRMAPVDLPRARRILDRLNQPAGPGVRPRPEVVAEGLARMAAARAETDPAGARALLGEAFDRLRQLANERPHGAFLRIAKCMAVLLPLVERIDSDRLEERLWLAAAHREPPYPSSQSSLFSEVQEPVVLAALVARYDRELAAAIIAPALDRMPDLLAEGVVYSYYQFTPSKALAVYDPRAITAILRGLPASARRTPPPQNGRQFASTEALIRLEAAQALGLPMDERYRKILGGRLGFRPLSVRMTP